jgi:hypothetical protein
MRVSVPPDALHSWHFAQIHMKDPVSVMLFICKRIFNVWSVIGDGVWIGNLIYWTLTERNYK